MTNMKCGHVTVTEILGKRMLHPTVTDNKQTGVIKANSAEGCRRKRIFQQLLTCRGCCAEIGL